MGRMKEIEIKPSTAAGQRKIDARDIPCLPGGYTCTPQEIHMFVFETANIYRNDTELVVKSGARGLVRHFLGIALPDKRERHAALGWVLQGYGEMSTNDMFPPETLAMLTWINPEKVDGEWVVREFFFDEIRAIAALAISEQ